MRGRSERSEGRDGVERRIARPAGSGSARAEAGRSRRVQDVRGLLAAAAGLLLLVPTAGGGALPPGLSLELRDRARLELWRFFEPAPPGGDPDYEFLANQLRFDVRYRRAILSAHAAFQWVQLANLPRHASGTPGGALGTGALYFAHAGQRSPSALQIRALELGLRDPWELGLSLDLGRFGYSSGGELDSGVPKIEAVKATRIADRLVGEFGWSHFQRSFDGVKLRLERAPGQVGLAFLRPTEGGFEDGGNTRMDDIDLAIGTLTARPGALVPGLELQAFYLLYDDERRVRARPDNTGLPPPSRQDLRIHTVGGHAVGAWSVGPGELDGLFWGALQRGRWLEQDHRAYAGALEVGYQLPELPGRPWLRIGAFRSSGDSNPFDGTHETFFQVLPTARLYSLTAAYNLMNSTDAFVELRLFPLAGLTLRLDAHALRLTEGRDRWYAGAGATRQRGAIFGYGARATGGARELGRVVELSASWAPRPWVNLSGFYGRIFGREAVQASFARDDDLDFFYLELTLRWKAAGPPAP